MSTDETENKRVLIVEDDAFVALDLSDLLKDAGFEIMACVGTTEAAMAILGAERPDMAVIDFNLRSETSQPIAERLAELDVPFLFLSGRRREEIDTDRPHMQKPFMGDALVEAVRRLSD